LDNFALLYKTTFDIPLIPRLHDTTSCQTSWTAGQMFTRCSRLFNRFDNQLYRVNGA